MEDIARRLRVLLVEDLDDDAVLAVRELSRNGYTTSWQRVETPEDFRAALAAQAWDLVLCDNALPRFHAVDALAILQGTGIDVPFVVLSGTIGEEAAVGMLKSGAADVVLKANLARLGLVAEREIQAAANRRIRRSAEQALSESEARKTAILDSALDAIITIDAQGRVLEFNRAAERIFGYPRAEALGQEIVTLIVPTALRDAHRAGLESFRQTGRGRILNQRVELTAARADGSEFPVELAVVPVELPDATLFTAYIRDITDRERLERQLQQSQRLESLGQLAGGVAHDFNNLLGVIGNYTAFAAEEVELAAAGPDRQRWAAVRKDLAAVQDAAERAARLTRQLLAFARRDTVRLRVLDLNEIVADIEELLRRTIGEHIELVTERSPDLWPTRADPVQLEQVLVNLAVNARDAMPSGGRLTIQTANVDVDDAYALGRPSLQPGRYVRLCVSDTGEGMEPAVLARAFEPFFSTKPRDRGTGLGLATIYGIIAQAGGHAQLYSEPALGTTFTALLPAADQPAERAAPSAAPLRLIGDETILVIDDEAPIRDLTRRILHRNGYQVIVAVDARQAIDLVQQRDQRIDLLITDVVMPRTSGKALANQLTEIRPDLPVLYMSGHAHLSLDATGVIEPHDLLIEKPFTEAQLLSTIRKALVTRS